MDSVDWVTIARIAGARGNKGEVSAQSLSSHPERFENLHEVEVSRPDGSRIQLVVEEIWEHKDRLIFKFQGVDSISDAEKLAWCRSSDPRAGSLANGRGRVLSL